MDLASINEEDPAMLPKMVLYKQHREEASQAGLNDKLRKVYARFSPELQSESVDLSQRSAMTAVILAMVENAPTYKDAREGLKQIQAIHGHSISKVETHNHLTLEARLETGIEQAKAMGLIPEGQESQAVVEVEVDKK